MKRLNDFFDNDSKYIFIFSAILMFITHGFCFFNILYSHDSLSFYDINYTAKFDLGRWLYPAFELIRDIASPWMMGIFSTLFVSLSVVLTVKILEFNRIEGMCVSVIFVTNIALISLFSTFSFDADADTFALLLACYASYAFKSYDGKKKYFIPIISLIGCLSLYQAYIDVTIGLFLFILIYKLIRSNDSKNLLSVVTIGLKELLILIISSVIYIVIVKCISLISGISIEGDYNSAGNVANLNIKNIIFIIPRAYGAFVKRIIYPDARNTFFVLIALFALVLCTIFSLIKLLKHNIETKKVVLFFLILFIMPLGLNAIDVISLGALHHLMIFAFYLILLLPLILYKLLAERFNTSIRLVFVISVLSIFVIGFSNIIFANAVYTYKKIVYDNTLLHAHSVWEDVNSLNGYIEGETPVTFIGMFSDESSKTSYESYISNRYSSSFHAGFSSSIAGKTSSRHFYEGILGRNMKIVYPDEESLDMKTISNMPTYPTEGYCQLVGDIVVVKLSNEN